MYNTYIHIYIYITVSPESITQSEPSKTALATSVVSARVGRGLEIMLNTYFGLACVCINIYVYIVQKHIDSFMHSCALCVPVYRQNKDSALFKQSCMYVCVCIYTSKIVHLSSRHVCIYVYISSN